MPLARRVFPSRKALFYKEMTAQPNSENAAIANAAQTEILAKAGRELVALTDAPPFSMDGDAAGYEDKAKTLVRVRDASDAELGFVLNQLRDTGRHIDRGFDRFNTYVEDVLQFSAAKASSLIQGWEDLESLGLPPAILASVSWSKFRALGPAIRNGVIDKDNIYSYLPKIVGEGEHALRVTDLQDEVKLLTAKQVTEEAQPGDFQKVSFNVPADQMEDFQKNLNVVKEQFGQATGTTPITELVNFGAAAVVDDTMDTKKVDGLLGLKRKAEALVPGVTVIFLAPDKSEFSREELGIVPATYIWQDANDEVDGFVIATDEEDAKRYLGSDSVVCHRLFATESYEDEARAAATEGLGDAVSSLQLDGSRLPADTAGRNATMKAFAGILKEHDPEVGSRFQEFRTTLSPDLTTDQQFEESINWMFQEAEMLGVDDIEAIY